MSQQALSRLGQHLWFGPTDRTGVCLAKRLNNVALIPPRKALAVVSDIYAMDDAAAQRAQQWWAPAEFKLGEKRRLSSIIGVHALWMDIDFKQYECDRVEAVEIIKRLLEDLPPSAVIYTGGGFHVYWLLNQWLKPADWKQMAVRLSTHATSLGVIHDSKVTRNAAALMRIPGGWSVKRKLRTRFVQARLERVYDVAYLEEHLPAVEVKTHVPVELPFDPPQFGYYASAEAAEAAEGGTVSDMDPVPLKDLVEACPQVAEFVRARGRISEPAWYAMAGLFAQVVNGEELYHKISSGDPRYDKAQTQAKFDQWRSAVGLPPTCSALADGEPGICARCPRHGVVNSPLGAAWILQDSRGTTAVAAELPPAAVPGSPIPALSTTAYIPVPPAGYVAASGRLFRLVQTSEGDNSRKFLCGVLLLPLEVMTDYDGGLRELKLQVQERGRPPREIQVPVDAFSDQRQLHRELRQRAVFVEQHLLKDIAKYLDDCAQDMLRQSRVCRVVDQLGWTADGVFVLGHTAYKPASVAGNVQISSALSANLENARFVYGSKGSLDAWRGAIEIYNQADCEAYQMTLLAAFAAPLMEASTYSGALLSLVGPTAVGKSTVMAISNSVYGEMFSEQFGRADTVFGRFKVIGLLHNLPVYLDEATVLTPEETSALVFSLTQGRSGVAGTTDGNLRGNIATWNTIMVSGSNVSLHDMLAENSADPGPEVRRVLEVDIDRTPLKQADVDVARRIIKSNYGVAGAVWLRHLVDKGIAYWRKKIHAAEDELGAMFSNARVNRFSVLAIGACSLVAAREARDLGLLPFDPEVVPALLKRVLNETDNALVEIKSDAPQLIANMLTELEPFTRSVVVDKAGRFVDETPAPRSRTLVRVDRLPDGTRRAYIKATEFTTYLVNNRRRTKAVLEELEDLGAYTKNPKQPSHSIPVYLTPTTPVKAYKINLSKLQPDTESKEQTDESKN